MKNILLVTSYFPPSERVGAVRPAKFAQYLPEFGWRPIVLTPDRGQIARANQSDIPVYYAPFPNLEGLFSLGRRLFPKPKRQSKKTAQGTARVSLDGRRRIFTDWLMIPDEAITWIPSAVRQGLEIAKSNPPHAILTTAPDYSCHLVGLWLSRRLNCPWLADFRDPWLTNPFSRYPTGLHRKIHGVLEGKIVRSAQQVVTISEPICQDFMSRYPDQGRDKFAIIYNGYDSVDFHNLEVQNDSHEKTIRVIHTGTLYGGRNPLPFLEALKCLGPSEIENLRVTFLGRNAMALKSVIDDLKLDRTVILKEAVPFRQSLQQIVNTDILLLIPGPGRGTLTTKLFEYLNAGKYILALVPSSNQALIRILKEAKTGFVVDPDSPDEIFRGLHKLIARIQSNHHPEPNWEFIRQFERKELTGQLVQILDRIAP